MFPTKTLSPRFSLKPIAAFTSPIIVSFSASVQGVLVRPIVFPLSSSICERLLSRSTETLRRSTSPTADSRTISRRLLSKLRVEFFLLNSETVAASLPVASGRFVVTPAGPTGTDRVPVEDSSTTCSLTTLVWSGSTSSSLIVRLSKRRVAETFTLTRSLPTTSSICLTTFASSSFSKRLLYE